MPSSSFLPWFVVVLLCPSLAHGQNALYVLDSSHAYRLVHKVDRLTPQILVDGKLENAIPTSEISPPQYSLVEPSRLLPPYPGTRVETVDLPVGTVPWRCRLQPVEEFFPAFVSVKVIRDAFTLSASTRPPTRQFQFTALFSSDFPLTDVFFVLEFASEEPERKYFVQEIPIEDLRLHRPIAVDVSFSGSLSKGRSEDKYSVHVFSRGAELLQISMSRSAIESALGKIVKRRIAGLINAQPKVLTKPELIYPEKFAKSKLVGTAVISCTIAANGQPTEIAVKSATDPAFAEAALNVMPQWWFVPRVENGQPVASKAELPFEFKPPKS